jgi:glycosyltransferase involved in cell wall biosynthesis
MSDSLKIGIVGPLPPPAGGMATQTRQLFELLAAEGLNVRVIQTNSPYSPSWVGNIKGIRAIFRLLPYFLKVWKLAGQVNVIHLMANSGWSWQLFSAPVIWIGWLRKTAVVVNYRGGEAEQYFRESIRWVAPSMNKAAEIVVPSPYLKKVFSEQGFNVTVIPNIVNFERFKPCVKSRENTNQEFKLIVTRNLEPIYGLPTAIRAVARATKELPNLKLLIAGSGPQKKELLKLIDDLDLQNNVSFVGRLGPGEIELFYRDADIMLNPTTVDNMPNSVLEALASGLPIITTDVGGIPYIVDDEKTALMVSVGDDEAMARQIIRLYKDEGVRQTLINNGLKEVAQYGWSEVKQRWISSYQRLGKSS